MSKVRVRFAPSPTGDLHIGGARTALFNWVFARQHQGQFLLRIEDTDQKRCTEEYKHSILNGLRWLGLDWDEEPVYQSRRKDRHLEVAHDLLSKGLAYYCVCPPQAATPPEEKSQNTAPCPCREAGHVSGALRLKRPLKGTLSCKDVVYGSVEVEYAQLDDMVLVRSNGMPTYMLCVVVDDYDMGITHIIRGVDHLTNTLRQMLLWQAMDWEMPECAHLPLIHGQDGKKFSKRHGAVSVIEYQKLGFLPDAVCNALMRMGWGHDDTELVTKEEAVSIFSLASVGKSKAQFDLKKLYHYNQHYMANMPTEILLEILKNYTSDPFDEDFINKAKQIFPEIVKRVKTLHECAEALQVLHAPKAYLEHVEDDAINMVRDVLLSCEKWESDALEASFREYCLTHDCKLVAVAQPLRVLITGKKVSPPIFLVMSVLGLQEVMERIKQYEEQASKSESP